MSTSDIESLPFVTIDEEGKVSNWWAPARTGDYAADCQAGREHAAALRRYFDETGNAAALPWVIRSMPRGDDFTGVEIGFCTQLACL